jgi:hypothetical protein
LARRSGNHFGGDANDDQIAATNPRRDHYPDGNYLFALPISYEERIQDSPHDAPPGLNGPILVPKRGADASNLDSSGALRDRCVQCADRVYTDQRRKHSRGGDSVAVDPVTHMRNADPVYLLPTPLFVARGSQMVCAPMPGNFNTAQAQTSPRVMPMVANVEQGQPRARRCGE